jgi:hypothetical protein
MMKNIKFLLALLLATGLGSFVKAQTKEETVQWLSDKISLYGEGCHEGISGSNITIYDYFNEITYTIPFDQISRIETYEWDGMFHGGRFTLYTFGSMITSTDAEGKSGSPRSSIDFSWSGCNGYPWGSEENLLSRLARAFNKLVYYNKQERPREAF